MRQELGYGDREDGTPGEFLPSSKTIRRLEYVVRDRYGCLHGDQGITVVIPVSIISFSVERQGYGADSRPSPSGFGWAL